MDEKIRIFARTLVRKELQSTCQIFKLYKEYYIENHYFFQEEPDKLLSIEDMIVSLIELKKG